MAWRAVSTRPVARHVIGMQFQPSFIEFDGILGCGEQYLLGALPATSSTRIYQPSFMEFNGILGYGGQHLAGPHVKRLGAR
jgi:hypothetical protein